MVELDWLEFIERREPCISYTLYRNRGHLYRGISLYAILTSKNITIFDKAWLIKKICRAFNLPCSYWDTISCYDVEAVGNFISHKIQQQQERFLEENPDYAIT